MSTEPKPKVCLIGTSNGVFEQGYVSAFRNSDAIASFSKNCLGYSSSAIFSQRAEMVDLATFDICVLDFAPNDAVALAGGATPPALVHSVVSDAVRRVLEKGCFPAIYMMPIRSQMRSQGKVICDIYKDIAQEFNLPLFDGYRYVEALLAQGFPAEDLYIDDMHLKFPVAIQLAEAFIGPLIEAWRRRAPQAEKAGRDYTYRYLGVPSFGLNADQWHPRKTWIFETNTVTVTDGMALTIKAAGDGEITAIGVDWANSSGSATFSSTTSARKKLSSQYSTEPSTELKKMIFGIANVHPPVKLKDGQLTLNLQEDEKWTGRLELGAIVVRHMADYAVRPLLPEPVILESFTLPPSAMPA
ncbi:SGNH/GDSL hydrolase family protein [Pseudoroseomonas globiformis]|uniref:SGNH/GDSL hydrolase family protein n=1 Tax=Teichococcus globiformis TaxID=2307229 RepID=A0ABV7FUZ4_9PROT